MASFSIRHNLAAMGVANQLNSNESALTLSIQRLASGLRINTPADDPASNAIAIRLQGKIDTLTQGALNAQDGISVLQIAQGGLGQITQILQRMTTLATEAANGASNDIDRQDIQQELNQLLQQMNQIVNQTKFGDQNLLDGSVSGVQAGVASTLLINTNAFLPGSGNSLVNAIGVGVASLLSPNLNATCFLDETFRIVITPSTVSASSFVVNVFASATVPVGNTIPDVTPIATLILAPTLNAAQSALVPITITSSAVGGATFVATLNFQGITVTDIANIISDNAYVSTQAYQSAITIDHSLLIQVGANLGEVDRIASPSVLTGNIFSAQSISVGTNLEAEGVLNQLAHATTQVTTDESYLGALQNRFNSIVSNDQILQLNDTASVSRIEDVDVASETTQLTERQILVQTATSMLAQANNTPAAVLSLLH